MTNKYLEKIAADIDVHRQTAKTVGKVLATEYPLGLAGAAVGGVIGNRLSNGRFANALSKTTEGLASKFRGKGRIGNYIAGGLSGASAMSGTVAGALVGREVGAIGATYGSVYHDTKDLMAKHAGYDYTQDGFLLDVNLEGGPKRSRLAERITSGKAKVVDGHPSKGRLLRKTGLLAAGGTALATYQGLKYLKNRNKQQGQIHV